MFTEDIVLEKFYLQKSLLFFCDWLKKLGHILNNLECLLT